VTFLHALRRRLGLGSRSADDPARPEDRPDSGDARAAAEAQGIAGDISHSAGPGYPPGYVKDYDDGRPRK
jgi:hypothetical protein